MRNMDGVSTAVEARHRALIEALPDLLLRLGADGTYLELGGDLSRLANPPEIVVGANVRELLPARIAEQLMAGVASALANRAARDGELPAAHPSRRGAGLRAAHRARGD